MIPFISRLKCAVLCFRVSWWKDHPVFKAGYKYGLADFNLESESDDWDSPPKQEALRDESLKPGE